MLKRRVLFARILLMVTFVAASSTACGVAPISKGTPSLPPRWKYAGAHGRPLAWNGGVCADPASHEHDYPPSPRTAFLETPEGLKDTRKMWPFHNAHAHHGRTCFREGRHLHLEAPDDSLLFDDGTGAWRSPAS